MARTKWTARKSTRGAQIRISRAEQAPSAPVVEVEPEEPYFFEENEEGDAVPVNPQEEPAEEVSPVPEAPAAVVGEDPDPDDSGDDSSDDDDAQDDQEDQGNNPREPWKRSHTHTSQHEQGVFPDMLEDVLAEVGINVRPLYVTTHTTYRTMPACYSTTVHIRKEAGDSTGPVTVSVHECTTPHATYKASVNDAAKRALFSLCHTYRQELENTAFRHVPRRAPRTEQTVVPLGELPEQRLNTLASVTAGLNTDLENATSEIYGLHVELHSANEKIKQLVAYIEDRPPSPSSSDSDDPAVSPPRKRTRYGEDGPRTGH